MCSGIAGIGYRRKDLGMNYGVQPMEEQSISYRHAETAAQENPEQEQRFEHSAPAIRYYRARFHFNRSPLGILPTITHWTTPNIQYI